MESRIAEHEQKLQEYIENPDAFDNKGFLRNADPELRQRIIDGRIKSLTKEIEKFKSEIEKLRGSGQ